MMYVVRDLLRSPAAIGIAVAAVLAVILARTRFARLAVYATPLLVVLCMEAGRFDGHRHLTTKLDATFFVWIQAVELRAVTGLAVLLVAAPIGAAAAKLLPAHRGVRLGLAALGPCGVGLLASSALVLRAVPEMLALPVAEDRLGALRTLVVGADAVLAVGTLLSIVVCAGLAIGLLRADAPTFDSSAGR
jgi:hypothetical protein